MMNLLPSMYTALLLLSCLSFLQSSAEVPCGPVAVRSCPGEEPKASLVYVFITDCFEEPCQFKRGQNVTMEMDIEFQGDVQRLEARLYALLGPVPIKWDGINPEACEDIVSVGGSCPLKADDYITYGVDLFILPNYPRVRTDVMFMVLDEHGETQVCWIVLAEVS